MMQRYYFLLENMYRAMMIFWLTCLVGYPRTSAPEPDFLLRIPQTWRNSPGAKLLFTPEQHGREVEHSLWALRTTPHTYYGCCTLSGLPSESKARSFSQKLNVVHASLREWGLLSASATWSIRSLGKSTASYIFVYIYIAVLAYLQYSCISI